MKLGDKADRVAPAIFELLTAQKNARAGQLLDRTELRAWSAEQQRAIILKTNNQ
jgi:hypothetical protein